MCMGPRLKNPASGNLIKNAPVESISNEIDIVSGTILVNKYAVARDLSISLMSRDCSLRAVLALFVPDICICFDIT